MNPILIAAKVKSVLAALRPVGFAIIGGLTVAIPQRCSKPEPVQINLNNQAYEYKLDQLSKKQDSTNAVLPDMSDALRYLSKRYPDRK